MRAREECAVLSAARSSVTGSASGVVGKAGGRGPPVAVRQLQKQRIARERKYMRDDALHKSVIARLRGAAGSCRALKSEQPAFDVDTSREAGVTRVHLRDSES